MKKIISLLLIAILTVSMLGMTVSASSFADLNDSRWDWARDAIDSMTEQGLIAGYSETEFGPADGVTTLQAMLFMSRIVGFYESANQDVVQKANELYSDFLESYNLNNQSEIALLMYYGIFTKSELQTYLASSKINKGLKRYEAAVFLTKTAGAEKNLGAGALSFDDANEIPNDAKNYVSYVVNQGYMVGMSDTSFGANVEVNRAQMATMLYRVIKDLNITYVAGEVVTVSNSSISVKTSGAAKAYEIPAAAEVRINGQKKSITNAISGESVVLKYYNGSLRYVDVISLDADSVQEGYVTSKKTGTPNEVTLVTSDSATGTVFTLASGCKIHYNNKAVSFSDLTLGDNVTIYLKNDEIAKIEIAQRTNKVTSVEFAGIVYEPELGIITETSSGVKRTYLVANKVTVKKNSKLVELKDLLVGDNLTLTLDNNKVSSVIATSTKKNTSGTIEEIIISATPSITVNNGKTSSTYALNNATEITVDGETGDIYDLRLGYAVDITLESDTIIKITSKVVQATNTLMGVIDSVNSSYGFLYVYATDTSGSGTTERIQVFTKKSNGTKIIDNKNDNNTRALDKILPGESVLVSGVKQADGTFEASTIIILVN